MKNMNALSFVLIFGLFSTERKLAIKKIESALQLHEGGLQSFSKTYDSRFSKKSTENVQRESLELLETPDDVNKIISLAISLCYDGDYSLDQNRARKLCYLSLAKSPKTLRNVIDISSIFAHIGNPDDVNLAKQLSENAAKADTNDTKILFWLQRVFIDRDDILGYEATGNKIRQLEPFNWIVLSQIGDAHRIHGRFEEAKKFLCQCYNECKEEISKFNSGLKIECDVDHFRAGVAQAAAILHDLHKKNGNMEMAFEFQKEWCENIWSLGKFRTDDFCKLGSLYEHFEDFEKARECYEKAIAYANPKEFIHFSFSVYFRLGLLILKVDSDMNKAQELFDMGNEILKVFPILTKRKQEILEEEVEKYKQELEDLLKSKKSQ